MALRTLRLTVPTLVAASALALAGCSSSGGASESDDVTIVTSTNVYGDIAQAIAGDAATVTSIIGSPTQDPHDYEAGAADQLTVQRADLLIENGGGYDAFMDGLIEASGTDAPVIVAAEFSHDWPGADDHGDAEAHDEHAHGHTHIEGFNEHVWYDPHTMEHVAEAIAQELTTQLPEHAAEIEANTQAFLDGIAGLEAALADIEAAHAGAQVFVTEPAPVYLTTAAGLVDVAPAAFSEAVEEGQDVAPAILLTALDAVRSGQVRVVIANAQTGGAETTQVIDAATADGISVLEFTETLPKGQTYLQWMQQNIADLAEALAS